MTSLKTLAISITAGLVCAPAQAFDLKCTRLPLIAENFVPCEGAQPDRHGGSQFCGTEKRIASYISDLDVVIDDSEKATSMQAHFINESKPIKAHCEDAGSGLAGQRCTFANGVVVDVVALEKDNYRVILFAKDANSPSYTASTNKECEVVGN